MPADPLTPETLAALREAVEKMTPGPWQVVVTEHPYSFERADGTTAHGVHVERRIFTAWEHPQMHGPIGVVNYATGIGARFVSIREADARLIAAVPALLEAAEENERLRAALVAIARDNELVDANPDAFSVHAVRMMKAQARVALHPKETPDAEA